MKKYVKHFLLFTVILFVCKYTQAQQLQSVSPASANRGQALNITITGNGTHFTQGSATVSFFQSGSPVSNIYATNYTPISDTKCLVTLSISPSAKTGLYTVNLYHMVDGLLSLPSAFNISASGVALTAITPATVLRGSTLNVQITGTGTSFVQGSTTLSFFSAASSSSDIIVNSVTVNSPTTLTANVTTDIHARAGFYNFKSFNPVNGYVYNSNPTAFEVLGPTMVLTPNNSYYRNKTLSLSITGTATNFKQGSGTTLSFYRNGSPTNDLQVLNYTTYTNLSITASIKVNTFAQSGVYYQLVAKNATDGEVTADFYITTPYINNISPDIVTRNSTLDILISGKGTIFTQASRTTGFFLQSSPTVDIVVNSFTPLTDTTAKANITVKPFATLFSPYAFVYTSATDPPLSYNIKVKASGGFITNVYPLHTNRSQTLDITITGSNTHFAQGSNVVSFFKNASPTTDVMVNSYQVISDTLMKANITTPPWDDDYDLGVENMQDGPMVFLNALHVFTGINETENKAAIKVFPNPLKDKLYLSCQSKELKDLKVSIYSLLGEEIVREYSPSFNSAMNVFEVDLQSFSFKPGMYFIKIDAGGKHITQRVLIE